MNIVVDDTFDSNNYFIIYVIPQPAVVITTHLPSIFQLRLFNFNYNNTTCNEFY